MSLRSAINAFCRACLHDSREKGTWREQIGACTARACPLFKVRPKPTKRSKPAGVATAPDPSGDSAASDIPVGNAP
jgi:hypothetical protein